MRKFFFLNLQLVFFFCLATLLGLFIFLPSPVRAFTVSAEQVKVNDPGFSLNALNIDKEWGLTQANFPNAWDKTLGSTSTIVAIIDTGIDETHEDLQNVAFVPGFDFVKNQAIAPGTNSDDNGHGTLVAGVLGATPNNSKGIAGTNWFVSLMPVKALDNQGKGDSSTVAQAIIWASDHGAAIINLSLGGSGFEHDADLSKAVRYAFNQGAVIIAAAGNDTAGAPRDLDASPVFPVCNDNDQNMVIGVSAVDQNNVKPDFANYGKNCVDVVAPGKRILSTISIDPITRSSAQNGYAYVSGTSLAAAFVSGEAALIKSLYSAASNKQIRDRIIATAKSVDPQNLAQCGGRSCRGLLGAGLINASQSLDQNFPLPAVFEGDVVKAVGSTTLYWIYGGQKRPISPFVFNQRFIDLPVKIIPQEQLIKIPDGPYATPLEGTLVKVLNNPTVYLISSGLKLPITAQIFGQRGFNYADIKTVDVLEFSSWVSGKFLTPKEGTLVKAGNAQTLYWTAGGSLHPINMQFYKDRGLWIFPVINVTQKDFMSYNIGEAYIR